MKNSELIESLSQLDKDAEVEIRIIGNSIGPSATSQIKSVFSGFDWDDGKILVNTKKTLIEYDEYMLKISYRKRCTKCDNKVPKKYNYCPECGNKLK